jgi:hypothetical protein
MNEESYVGIAVAPFLFRNLIKVARIWKLAHRYTGTNAVEEISVRNKFSSKSAFE